MDSEYISITEAVKLTGKHDTTIYKAIRRGKLTATDFIENSKTVKKLLKTDVIRLYGIKSTDGYRPSIDNSTDDYRPTTDRLQTSTDDYRPSIDDYKKAIEEVLETKQSQLMKPIEEQALYLVGELRNEVKHLQAEKDTLRQENELLREQVKALPDLKTIQEKEKNLIIQIEMERKEKEDLLFRGEGIRQDTEEKLKQSEEIHRKELEARQKEMDELHRQEMEKLKQEHEKTLKLMSESAEKEKMEIVEAWKKKTEELERPWWKFW